MECKEFIYYVVSIDTVPVKITDVKNLSVGPNSSISIKTQLPDSKMII